MCVWATEKEIQSKKGRVLLARLKAASFLWFKLLYDEIKIFLISLEVITCVNFLARHVTLGSGSLQLFPKGWLNSGVLRL